MESHQVRPAYWRIPTYADALRRIAPTASPATIESIVRQRLTSKGLTFAQLDRDVLDMLRDFRSGGVQIGVVSNCAREDVEPWAGSPLASLIEVTVFSCKVGVVKPDAAIYHLACDMLGVAPNETVFVGDGAFNELSGARKAGLSPLWATWFLERWPASEVRSALALKGFERVRRPADLVRRVSALVSG